VSSSSPSAPLGVAPWLDEGEPNPTWPPPVPREPRTRPVPRAGLVYACVGLALVLLVAAVWGFGGFRKRTDLLIPTAPGTTISTGPYELAFTRVTAQRTTESGTNAVSWSVKVVGTGRTTGARSIAPEISDDGMFASKDPGSGEIEVATGQDIGNGGTNDRTTFTPGAPPLDYAVTFTYAASYAPGPTLRFLVSTLEFTDTSLVGDGKKTWNNTSYAYEMFLPVQVLPPVTN
jgi:hypothetical protein